MSELDGLLDAIVADPRDEARWQVLADWLDDYDGARFCRCAYRRHYDPGPNLDDVGCRVVPGPDDAPRA